MQAALIGLGRMGKNIALHLLEQGVSVIAYNRSPQKTEEVAQHGATAAYNLKEIPQKFTESPVVVILLVPAGAVVDEMLFGARASIGHPEKGGGRDLHVEGLVDILPQGSIIIDAGNSFYKDSQRRYEQLTAKGFHFLDMGTSGGMEGARTGATLMVGGNEAIYTQVEPLLGKIATKDGYGYVGPSGAGHYVKMIHNGIEYGMMGAIAEGFNLLGERGKGQGESNDRFEFDLGKIAKIWAHGSIVSGLLMNMAVKAFAKDPQLDTLDGSVPKGETEAEMEWLQTTGVPQPVIQAARQERVESRTKPSFIGKVIAALRREFGGHSVK